MVLTDGRTAGRPDYRKHNGFAVYFWRQRLNNKFTLASCLIYARADLLAATHYPPPISVLVWVRSFIQLDVLKTMYCSRIPLRFI